MHLNRWTLLCCALGVALLSGIGNADNWPRFRGTNGVGIAADQKVPTSFSDSKNVKWKIKVPGVGNSSPVIWEDKLFVQTSSEDGNSRELLCINAKTGDTIWSKSVDGKKAHTHSKNTMASSTPAVDGKRVYVSYWDGKRVTVQAYSMKGKHLWTRDVGGFKSQHGNGASPVVYGDKVYIYQDQDLPLKKGDPIPETLTEKQKQTAVLYCLDAKNGKVVWSKTRLPYRACYGAPLLWDRPGAGKEIVITSTRHLTGYDPDTGEIKWNWAWEHRGRKFPLRVTGSPVVFGDTVYAYSGDGGGARNMVAVKVGSDSTKPEPKLSWESDRDTPYVPSALIFKDKLFFVHDHGIVSCLDPTSGDVLLKKRLPDAYITASPVIAGNNIFVCSEQGEVFVLSGDEKLNIVATNDLGEMIRATPAVAHNCLYVRGQEHLFCIGK